MPHRELLFSRVGSQMITRRMAKRLGFLLLLTMFLTYYFNWASTFARGKQTSNNLGFSTSEASTHPKYLERLQSMLHSLLMHSSARLHFHVLAKSDDDYVQARSVIVGIANELDKEIPLVSQVQIGKFSEPSHDGISHMLSTTGNSGETFYNESIAAYPYLRDLAGVSELAVVDIDTVFAEDVSQLFLEFQRFPDTALIGGAPELNPSFSDRLDRKYGIRKDVDERPNLEFGATRNPPRFRHGFNTDILLLKLDKMRGSEDYEYYVGRNGSTALLYKHHLALAERRNLPGHRDFFAALSFERPDMFHLLGCGWNRHLCRMPTTRPRTNEGIIRVARHGCEDAVKVYHAKCTAAAIPHREA